MDYILDESFEDMCYIFIDLWSNLGDQIFIDDSYFAYLSGIFREKTG